jgi:hypothetical protein
MKIMQQEYLHDPDLTIDSPYAFYKDLWLGLRPYDPPTLYRHMERKWAEALVNDGTFQISPMARYRDEAVSNGSIHDQQDGKQRTELSDADLIFERTKEFGSFQIMSPNLIVGPEGRFFGYNSHPSDEANNEYVYCLSERGDIQLSKELDPKYDTIVKIEDPIGLFLLICNDLLEKEFTNRPFVGHCIYDGSKIWKNPLGKVKHIPRALQKRADHDFQKEVRFVFPAMHPITGPTNLTIPKIGTYCTIL